MENGIRLETIAEERRRKLRSVLTDRTDFEQTELLDAISGDPTLSGAEGTFLPTLEYIRAQGYGERDLDRYYAAHPIRVARFLVEWSAPRTDSLNRARRLELVSAGLVHNAIEKKVLGHSEAALRFGAWVADAVETITVDRVAMASREGVVSYYATLAQSDPGVRALKIFDKFDNLFVLCVNPDDDVRASYLLEIEEFLLPIIESTAPEILDYTKSLIDDGRVLGYYRPAPEQL